MIPLLIGIVVGAILGLTGAGGSLIAFPILLNGLGLSAHQASGIALCMVAASAWSGVATRVSRQEIVWPPAVIFAVSGGLSSPLGRSLAHQVSEQTIVLGFTGLMLFIALKMVLQSTRTPEHSRAVRASATRDQGELPRFSLISESGKPRWFTLLGLLAGGVATGIMSGFFGVGGGFIVVPALVLITQLKIQQAVGTSIFIVAVVSSAGFLSYLLKEPEVPWALVGWLSGGGVLGMLFGTLAGRLIAGPVLQRIFAAMLLAAVAANLMRL